MSDPEKQIVTVQIRHELDAKSKAVIEQMQALHEAMAEQIAHWRRLASTQKSACPGCGWASLMHSSALALPGDKWRCRACGATGPARLVDPRRTPPEEPKRVEQPEAEAEADSSCRRGGLPL